MGVHLAPDTVNPGFVKVEFVHSDKIGGFADDFQVLAVKGIILGDGFTS